MFENIFSFGSLLAITISITLTIKSIKITNTTNNRINSPDVTGNNNQVIINQSNSKQVADFKQLSNIIITALLFLFPLFPNFFIKFLSTFSLCSIILCVIGFCRNIQQKNNNAGYSVIYIPITLMISILSITAVFVSFSGGFMFTDYYSRLIEKLKSFYISTDYLTNLNALLFEGTAYVGFSLLFASLIHVCFGFLKARNFDETFNFIKFWLPFSLVGHFLASGCLIALYNQNFQYIIYIYKNLPFNFLAYFI